MRGLASSLGKLRAGEKGREASRHGGQPHDPRRVAGSVDDAVWNEIGIEEAAIRANPQATGDPVLIGVFGTAARI